MEDLSDQGRTPPAAPEGVSRRGYVLLTPGSGREIAIVVVAVLGQLATFAGVMLSKDSPPGEPTEQGP